MLEEDRVGRVESDLDYRDNAGVQLTGARRPVELGQVPQPGRLAPPRVGYSITDVERGAAMIARTRRTGALGVAPPALDALLDVCHSGHPHGRGRNVVDATTGPLRIVKNLPCRDIASTLVPVPAGPDGPYPSDGRRGRRRGTFSRLVTLVALTADLVVMMGTAGTGMTGAGTAYAAPGGGGLVEASLVEAGPAVPSLPAQAKACGS